MLYKIATLAAIASVSNAGMNCWEGTGDIGDEIRVDRKCFIKKWFNKCDENNDGKINFEEEEACREAFTQLAVDLIILTNDGLCDVGDEMTK